jgi:glycosyltransferase involved in cell wall biosynthesis
MKVLMIAPQPFFEPRGTPISVYQRLNGLSELGHEVDLVTYPIGADVEIPGVTIRRTFAVPFIKTIKIGPSFAKIILDIPLFFYTFWLLLTRRYDVIHSHEEGAFFALLLAPLFRTPHIYDMHSSLPKQLANFNFGNYRPFVKLFDRLERRVLKTADVVLTIGRDLEEHVLATDARINHIRIENVAVHNNTADDQPASQLRDELGLTDELCLVYTGTFERYQGLDLLFDSMQQVTAVHPQVRLIMVGGKPGQVAHWQTIVAGMGLAEQVHFVGTVPLAESLRYLDMANILVSPRTEGLSVPLKIYSYLHAGRPMVATNILAHTQVLGEETAVLTDPTPDAYAAGLLQLIADPTLRQQIGEAAYQHAEAEFSFKQYLHKLEKAYLSIQLSTRITDLPKSETLRLQSAEG